MSKWSIVAVALTAVLIGPVSAPIANAEKSVGAQGNFGESISITKNKLSKAQNLVVTGRGFDETTGIYLAYCVMPKTGQAPTPCGGGVNKQGIGDASHWISSNAPPYAEGLAVPFLPGGRFTEKVFIAKKIGKFDCRKVKCAITVRSDHLHEGDRTRDLFIPITFTK
jgi:hypothetical protein